ncbi:MAG TPA: 50S ribosomal protein L24 [Clostridia bacterium]|nr:50S ribosomal protein L24 [Clostridia bacterium]
MSFSVKKGDYVKIIAGDDKGKMAQIIAVNTDKGRVFLEGKDISVAKKAKKSRKANDKSGIITIPKSISVSNVMPVCASCGKTTRVKYSEVDGKKVRTCECGAVLETKKVATKEEKKAKATVRKKVKATEEIAVNTAEETTVAATEEKVVEATEAKAVEATEVKVVKAVKKPAAKVATEESVVETKE